MLDLSTDTAQALAETNLTDPVWLLEIDADARDGGAVTVLRYGTRALTVGSNTYAARLDIQGLTITQGAFRRRAGLAVPSQATCVLYDTDSLSSMLASQYVLDNDTARLYLAVGTPADADDLIPILTGTIREQRRDNNRFVLSLQDETDQLMPAFPQQLLSATQYPHAPVSSVGRVIPQPIGELRGEGFYDLSGLSYNLAPCRCTDQYEGTFLPGLSLLNADAVYIERQGALVQVDDTAITDEDGHAFRLSGRERKLRLRPAALDEGEATITDFSDAADMSAETHVRVGTNEVWAFIPQSIRQQGDITQLRLGVHYKGRLTASVSGAATASSTALADHATAQTDYLSIPHTAFAESWDFIGLICRMASPGETELYAAWIEVDYDDWLEYDFADLAVFQAVDGLGDEDGAYADGSDVVSDGTLLENPIDVIEGVLRARTLGAIEEARINATSQSAARTKRDGWRMSQSLAQQHSADYIGEIASEAMTHLWIDGNGEFSFTPMARDGAVRWAFRQDRDCDLADAEGTSRIRVGQTPMSEILNDSALAYGLDVRTSQPARQAYRSYQFALSGTAGALSDGSFTDSNISDWTAVAAVGWRLWTVGKGQFLEVTAVAVGSLTVKTVEGYRPFAESSIGEWYLGPELDPDSRRSALRYKRRSGFGRAREGFEQSTSWALDWINDADTAELIADLARDYYVDRLKVVQLTTWWQAAALERGDVVLIDGDALGQHGTDGLGTVDVTAAADSLSFDLGVRGKQLKEDDWLTVGGEVVQVTALTQTAQGIEVTTDRGQFGTEALTTGSHSDLAVELYVFAWQVQAIQIAPDAMRWTYTLQQVPSWFAPQFNATARISTIFDDDMRRAYDNLADDSGLINPRDFEALAPRV